MESRPRFLQGTYSFEGHGLREHVLLDETLVYHVPSDRRAQLIYFRAGNTAGELVTLVLYRDGEPMRYFPVGARATEHVSLAVTEDIFPETRIEIRAGAESGVRGSIVLDVGLVEIY